MNTSLHEANSIFRERGEETRKGIPRSQQGESGNSIELRRGECRVVGGFGKAMGRNRQATELNSAG